MGKNTDEINCWVVMQRPDNGEDTRPVAIFTNFDWLEEWIDRQDSFFDFEIRGFMKNKPYPLGDE
jgi:hypothetical protein